MKESFSNNVKRELLLEEKIKKCCAFSLIYGFAFLGNEENGEIVIKKANAENASLLSKTISSILKGKSVFYNDKTREIRLNKGIMRFSTIAEIQKEIFKCDNCSGYFLRALFLMCGTVNNPSKSYSLELVFEDENKRNAIIDLLEQFDFSPRKTLRNGKHILYFRNGDQIEKLLAKIGAVNSTFEFINSKIFKEVTNNANRVANCDNANITKALKASEKYIDAILELIESGKIESLPEQLQETAKLRIQFKELNFEQLGKKFSPPISKSGIYHRLEKILEFYKNNMD